MLMHGLCAPSSGAAARRMASCVTVCTRTLRVPWGGASLQCRAGRGAVMVPLMTANVRDCCRCTRFPPTLGVGMGHGTITHGRGGGCTEGKRASVIVSHELHGGLTVFVSGVHSQCRVSMPRAHIPA